MYCLVHLWRHLGGREEVTLAIVVDLDARLCRIREHSVIDGEDCSQVLRPWCPSCRCCDLDLLAAAAGEQDPDTVWCATLDDAEDAVVGFDFVLGRNCACNYA